MKAIPRRLFLAVSALGFAVVALVTGSQTNGPAIPNPADTEKAVLARLNDIQVAAQDFDADKVFSFVMDNNQGVVAQNGKIFMTRSNALESTRENLESLRNAGAHVQYRFSQQHVTLLTPTIALAVGEGVTIVNTDDGRTNQAPFAQSVVLLFTNGDWKVFHAHRSFVVSPR